MMVWLVSEKKNVIKGDKLNKLYKMWYLIMIICVFIDLFSVLVIKYSIFIGIYFYD